MSSLSKKVYFRLDFGGLIGKGHLSRCRSIAKELDKVGIEPVFVIRKRPSTATIAEFPFGLIWMNPANDVTTTDVQTWTTGTEQDELNEFLERIDDRSTVVLDHYGLGTEFQKGLRAAGHRVVLIQDICSTDFNADVLINYNLSAPDFFKGKTDSHYLVGPEYAPLSDEFAKNHTMHFSTEVHRVGVYLGGIDPTVFESVAKGIRSSFLNTRKIDWITSTDLERDILNKVFSNQITTHKQLTRMISFYRDKDMFIGACGVSAYERGCLGLRQINFVIADNQKDIANNIVKNNLGFVLGDARKLSQDQMTNAIDAALKIPTPEVSECTKRFFDFIDGVGSSRIARALGEFV